MTAASKFAYRVANHFHGFSDGKSSIELAANSHHRHGHCATGCHSVLSSAQRSAPIPKMEMGSKDFDIHCNRHYFIDSLQRLVGEGLGCFRTGHSLRILPFLAWIDHLLDNHFQPPVF